MSGQTFDIVSSSTLLFAAGQVLLAGFPEPVHGVMFSTPGASFAVRYAFRATPPGAAPGADDPGTGYFTISRDSAPYVLLLPRGQSVVGVQIRAQNLTTENLSITGLRVF